ncbi:MAG TPA: hypothetical protein VGR67_09440 [Candidatus Polarisedimenticolia bacterium]|jgi:hypothetical protein|nr:hypothetical protein [Candidatus Polarisedimenticolia bacterium]
MAPRAFFLLLSFVLLAGAAPAPKGAAATPAAPAPMAELWVDPGDLSSRNLFYGPGGRGSVPDPAVDYQLRKRDTTGHSQGYYVRDPAGRKWKVKIGEEVSSEIAASRILWALGYRQPVLHYVPRWRLRGGPVAAPPPGRFRLESGFESQGPWDWRRNPFVSSRPYRTLVIVNLLLNNWDMAASNNRIYRFKQPSEGAATWYVVQDLGASLGKTRWPIGTQNDIEDFESQEFVLGAEDGRVRFDYHARHRELLRDLTPQDVVIACQTLAQLTDRQLGDAFRAGGYSEDLAARFIRKIKEKIAQGLALSGADDARPRRSP